MSKYEKISKHRGKQDLKTALKEHNKLIEQQFKRAAEGETIDLTLLMVSKESIQEKQIIKEHLATPELEKELKEKHNV